MCKRMNGNSRLEFGHSRNVESANQETGHYVLSYCLLLSEKCLRLDAWHDLTV